MSPRVVGYYAATLLEAQRAADAHFKKKASKIKRLEFMVGYLASAVAHQKKNRTMFARKRKESDGK